MKKYNIMAALFFLLCITQSGGAKEKILYEKSWPCHKFSIDGGKTWECFGWFNDRKLFDVLNTNPQSAEQLNLYHTYETIAIIMSTTSYIPIMFAMLTWIGATLGDTPPAIPAVLALTGSGMFISSFLILSKANFHLHQAISYYNRTPVSFRRFHVNISPHFASGAISHYF